MLRFGLVVMISCGGPTIRELPRTTVTCTDHWVTMDSDVIDLDVGADGRVIWLERTGGRLAAGPRGSEGRETLNPPQDKVYATELAVAGDKIAWAREDDGSIWKLEPGGKPTELLTIKNVTQLQATPDAIIVGAQDGIYKVTWDGEMQQVFSGEVWVMALDHTGEPARLHGNAVITHTSGAHTTGKLVRVSLDGQPPLTLAETPRAESIVVHDGKVLITAKGQGVLALDGDHLVPYAKLPLDTLIWNLRSANGRVYFTADNVVYQVRDGAAVPIAIAHEMIGDLEIDGEAIYTASRERTGVHGFCRKSDDPPVALTAPDPAKRTCLDGEHESESNDEQTFECLDASGNRTFTLGFHTSGSVFEEIARDGMQRTFYADGTPRSERPRGKAGMERYWYVNGKLRDEGPLDEQGEKHGTWQSWRPDGGIREAPQEWSHGKRTR